MSEQLETSLLKFSIKHEKLKSLSVWPNSNSFGELRKQMRSVIVAVLIAVGFRAPGQPVPAGRSFEVASIKVRKGDPQWKMSTSGPRITLEGYTLFGLVKEAYNLRNYEIAGVVGLLASDDTVYDVVARAESDRVPTMDEFRAMLQLLLIERFKIKAHSEIREMPIYALVVAKGGPKFQESPPDALPVAKHGVNGRNQSIALSRVTMGSVAESIRITFFLDRPVLDETGLSSTYDIKLEATPESKIDRNPDPSDVSVFEAVQYQLGLRLLPQKGKVRVLVIDHTEKMSEN